jgi:hypothetical protein
MYRGNSKKRQGNNSPINETLATTQLACAVRAWNYFNGLSLQEDVRRFSVFRHVASIITPNSVQAQVSRLRELMETELGMEEDNVELEAP